MRRWGLAGALLVVAALCVGPAVATRSQRTATAAQGALTAECPCAVVVCTVEPCAPCPCSSSYVVPHVVPEGSLYRPVTPAPRPNKALEMLKAADAWMSTSQKAQKNEADWAVYNVNAHNVEAIARKARDRTAAHDMRNRIEIAKFEAKTRAYRDADANSMKTWRKQHADDRAKQAAWRLLVESENAAWEKEQAESRKRNANLTANTLHLVRHPSERVSFLGFSGYTRPFGSFHGLLDAARLGSLGAHAANSVWAKPIVNDKTGSNETRIRGPELLDGSLAGVRVWWDGVKKPGDYDFVSVHCGKQQHPADILDYVQVNKKKSSGSVKLRGLVNMRCDYTVSYWQADANYPSCHATLRQCLAEHGNNDARCLHHVCPPGCRAPQRGGAVVGDNKYADTSSICRSAIHFGVLTDAGGPISLTLLKGRKYYRPRYKGFKTMNGVEIFGGSGGQRAFIPGKPQFEAKGLKLLARTKLRMGGKRKPMHPRLALTAKPGRVRVQWTAAGPRNAHPGRPKVIFGTSPYNFTREAFGFATSYDAANLCGVPANVTAQPWFRNAGWSNEVILDNLEGGRWYWYSFGNVDNKGKVRFSKEHSFYLPRAPSATGRTRFALVADMGLASGDTAAKRLLRKLRALAPSLDLIVHAGDLSYALGRGYAWEQWMHSITPLSKRLPYMVAMGNHEYVHSQGADRDPYKLGLGFHPAPWGNYRDDSAGECGVPTAQRFFPLQAQGKDRRMPWYSYASGNVLLVHISTEHDFTVNSPQYRWLSARLARVNRAVTPFVVVVGHRPLYASRTIEDVRGDLVVADKLREALEPVLSRFSVDAYLAGHLHGYERTCAVLNFTCKTDGTGVVHVTAGTGGASLVVKNRPLPKGVSEPWLQKKVAVWGFLDVATNVTHLTLRFRQTAPGKTAPKGTVVDSIVLTNQFSQKAALLPRPTPKSNETRPVRRAAKKLVAELDAVKSTPLYKLREEAEARMEEQRARQIRRMARLTMA